MQGLAVPNLNHVAPKMLVATVIQELFPSLLKGSANAASFQFISLPLEDLVSCRLVAFERNQDTWVVPAYAVKSGGGPIGKMTTDLGEKFLAFISE